MKYVFKLEELDCAHCASKMEKEIAKLAGVEAVNVSFLAQKLTIECAESDKDDILAKAKAICKKIEPDCVIIAK